jgi:hypothetical protein
VRAGHQFSSEGALAAAPGQAWQQRWRWAPVAAIALYFHFLRLNRPFSIASFLSRMLFFHVAGKINLNYEGGLKIVYLLLSLYILYLENF